MSLRQLQHQADDIAECLLIFQLEMRRSRTLEKRLEVYADFERAVGRIDVLRRDAEELLPNAREKAAMFDSLDRKAISVTRSAAYRVAEWFATADLGWFVGPVTIEPLRQVRPC